MAALSALSQSWRGALVAADEEYTRGSGRQGVGFETTPMTGHIDVLVQQGRVDEAQELADSMAPGRTDPPVFGALAQIELGRLLMAQGAPGPAQAMFEAAGEAADLAGIASPGVVPWRADAARALAAEGDWQQAGRLADENLRLARAFGAARTTGIALRPPAAATPDLAHRVEAAQRGGGGPRAVGRPGWNGPMPWSTSGPTLIALDRKEEARGVLRQGASLASLCGAHQLLEVAGDRLRAAGARPRRLGLGRAGLADAGRAPRGVAWRPRG